MKTILVAGVVLALISVGLVAYYQLPSKNENGEQTACTMEAKVCPDGSVVGRTGPNCEFAKCPEPAPADDVQAHIDSKADLIRVAAPAPHEIVTSPLTITGEARGTWYFEATFPVVLVDWDGRIIAEGYASAKDDWMTEEFVPFSATLEFEKPEYGARGALILQRSNPSGLPENDDALEIPVLFEEETLHAI